MQNLPLLPKLKKPPCQPKLASQAAIFATEATIIQPKYITRGHQTKIIVRFGASHISRRRRTVKIINDPNKMKIRRTDNPNASFNQATIHNPLAIFASSKPYTRFRMVTDEQAAYLICYTLYKKDCYPIQRYTSQNILFTIKMNITIHCNQ